MTRASGLLLLVDEFYEAGDAESWATVYRYLHEQDRYYHHPRSES